MILKKYVNFLRVIYEAEKPLSLTAIARRMMTGYQHVTAYIRYAEDKGHIEAQGSLDYRVKWVYTLSKKGQTVLNLL